MHSDCYCTTLRAASRRLAATYDAALLPLGLNVAQYALLRRVQKLETASLTQLGELLELDRSTVGRNVRVLERSGLLRMGRGEDQREATVALTKRGTQTLAAAVPLWSECQRELESRLGREPLQMLRETLRAL